MRRLRVLLLLFAKKFGFCIEGLKRDGQAILLIDKNLDRLLAIANRHYVIEKGRMAWSGTSHEFRGDPTISQRYLEVALGAEQL